MRQRAVPACFSVLPSYALIRLAYPRLSGAGLGHGQYPQTAGAAQRFRAVLIRNIGCNADQSNDQRRASNAWVYMHGKMRTADEVKAVDAASPHRTHSRTDLDPAADRFPGGQDLGFGDPSGQYWFAGHCVGAETPFGQYDPSGQSTDWVAVGQ